MHFAFILGLIKIFFECIIVVDGSVGLRYRRGVIHQREKMSSTSQALEVIGAIEKIELGSPTLHDEILTRVRDFIVEGKLEGGARIPERQLCEMFGISRTPLREALKVLAAEGVVDLLPNRGARVRALNGNEILDLFDLIGGLEALAGRLACEAITDQGIDLIDELHQRMYRCYLKRDLHGYFGFNQKIHEAILKAANNQALTTAYRSLSGRLRRVRYTANLGDESERWSEAVREHEVILDALRRRAGEELANILFVHLRNKRQAVLRHISADASSMD